jgi:hypothetical protein
MSHFISSLGEYTHTALAVESLTIYSTSYIYYAQPLNGRDAGSSSAGLPQYQYGGLSLTVGPESGGDLFFLYCITRYILILLLAVLVGGPNSSN